MSVTELSDGWASYTPGNRRLVPPITNWHDEPIRELYVT